MANHIFGDMLTEQSQQETVQEGAESGLNPDESFDAAEMSFVNADDNKRQSTAAEFKEPDKVVSVSKQLDNMKRNKVPMGTGIVSTIMAGLAGAFSKDGANTTRQLLDDWSGRRAMENANKIGADTLANDSRELLNRSQKLKVENAEANLDPESDISKSKREGIISQLQQLGFGQFASSFEGLSADQADKALAQLDPSIQKLLSQQYLGKQFDRTTAENIRKEGVRADENEKDRKLKAELEAEKRAAAEARLLQKSGGVSLTPAEKRVDSEWAKMQNAYTSGGREAFSAKMDNVREAVSLLQGVVDTGESLTGAFSGMVQKHLGEESGLIYGEKLTKIKDLIGEASMEKLRETLGSAFTENEGNKIAGFAFNTRATEEDNLSRAQKMLAYMESVVDLKDNKVAYMNENGTVSGWKNDKVTGDAPTGDKPTGATSTTKNAPRKKGTIRMTGAGGTFDVPVSQMSEYKNNGYTTGR